MNTLPRAITAEFFDHPTTYPALRAHWRALMTSDCATELAAEHHLLYLALLGKDWRKSFIPITNERKLANGAFQGWALFRALGALHHPYREQWLLAPFEGIVTSEMLQHIRQFVPRISAYGHQAAEFTSATFPVDAYVLPESLSTTASQ